MHLKRLGKTLLHGLKTSFFALTLFQFSIGGPLAAANDDFGQNNKRSDTTSPIKHVIVIIGENRTFDHVFATYKPKRGESVWNLLSEGIIKDDGTPGPNFNKAQQLAAKDSGTDPFLLSPKKSAFAGDIMPAPLAGGPKVPFIPNIPTGQAVENGLAPEYYQFLITGGTGLDSGTPDTRIANVSSLQAGPFQLTPGVPYDAYAASPVHRFYQMWQQLNCSVATASAKNPGGCLSDLFAWVEVTIGAGNNGKPQPAGFNPPYPQPAGFNINSTPTTTGEGSTALGFYNVQEGDAPYFK